MRPSSASSCPAAGRSAISSGSPSGLAENGGISSACCLGVASGSMAWIAAGELQAEPDVAGAVVGSPGAVDLSRRELALHRTECPAEQASLGVREPIELLGEGEIVTALGEVVEPGDGVAVGTTELVSDGRVGWDSVEQLLRGGHDGEQLLGEPEISSPSSSLPLRTATAMAPRSTPTGP